jgi:VWFA-related protein
MSLHRQIRTALLSLSILSCDSAADDSKDFAALSTYRSTVSEVRVTFFATDRNNHSLESLQESDFAVVDDKRVVRHFRSFARSTETSLEVVALLDASESVAPSFRAALGDVLQLVAREQSITDDNLSVVSFGGVLHGPASDVASAGRPGLRPAVICSGGCGSPDSLDRLRAAKSGGVTPFYDSLIFTSNFISQHSRAGGRPVVILFSDGDDAYSLHSAGEALQTVAASDALIYSVDLARARAASSGTTFLQKLSEATGGRYFALRLSPRDSATAVLNTVLEDLRASYVVTYDLPDHQTGFHALRLLPAHDLNLTFHSRNGYYYEPRGR